MIYRGQLLQDQWVLETLNYKTEGYFLDIGAFNGIDISNTYLLEKEFDWTGICVEAGKDNFRELIKHRNCKCVNIILSDVNGMVPFTEDWTVGRIGTGDLQESITFDRFLEIYNVPYQIDYISLDVEGAEYDVLKNFPFCHYRSRLWTIEHNAHDDDGVMRDKIRELMTANGYRLIRKLNFEDWWHESA